jgi:hypothetical protein
MSALLWTSIVVNALLGIALVLLVRVFRSAARSADSRFHREHEMAEDGRLQLQRLRSEYSDLAEAVGGSLEGLRQDIDRNYHHTHDGHVLDRIAYRLRQEIAGRQGGAYEIFLDREIARRVESAGGEVSSRGTMNLGQMLSFGWHLHTSSRERSGQLLEVVAQPCGTSGHERWLSKTLAIYELMCDRNKDLAVKRMSAVIEAWRHEPDFLAARYVEDVR